MKNSFSSLLLPCGFGLALFSVVACNAQVPEWIWSDNQGAQAKAHETRFFRKDFNVGFKAMRAELTASGDDEIVVYLNGQEAARSFDWMKPVTIEVTELMREGKNLLAVRGKNGEGGPAAVFVRLEVRSENNFGLFVTTDKTWLSSETEINGWHTPEFSASGWKPSVSFGKLGVAPWGNVSGPPRATPAESLTLLPGFKAELLKSAANHEGSWICMTIDDRGRLIISPEKNQAPMLRLTLSPEGQVVKTEPVALPMRAAMGLLYAHGSLYVNGHGPKGVGLYRLTDANQNDEFELEEIKLLKNFEGDSEHGYHAVVLGPDRMIYVINGNFTQLPAGLSPESPHRNFAEDLLLPRMWDANGHAKGVLAPGGHVMRTDPDGKQWELLLGGFRNAYDLDFNTEGEMFTFDSDMEWDIGAPWYRPTRINHCVIGGEYGWRSGSGKWPDYYPDNLPTTLDIGLSSPTGVKFGTGSNFPGKYRRAFFAADWNYGIIFAVHLEPRGASYTGTFENFVSGRPLNVTDLEFGQDGAMYFIIGGWRTQSGLYRISHVGPKEEEPLAVETAEERHAAGQRAIRRKLESFHGKKNPAALDVAWPYLNSEDRWLRFAARVAVESQEVSLWQRRALNETRITASINALLALARCGGKEIQGELIESLGWLAGERLSEEQLLEALRVLALTFIRMGKPEAEMVRQIVETLAPFYPADSEPVNRELCELLVYLEAPSVAGQTLELMAKAPTQEEQMHYAFVLRNLRTGWTIEQRRIYFSWFNQALREYRGGNSFAKFLQNIRQEALEKLTEPERAELASILEDRKVAPAPELPPREFVKNWTMEDLVPLLDGAGANRSFQQGKEAFVAAQCLPCHRMGTEGGAVGPDLTSVAGRFNRRDLLEHILLPSKVISDRYETFTITDRDGEDFSGYITAETDEKIVLLVNPMTQEEREILKRDIARREISTLSAMPEGLLNVLTQDEILDLLAYMEAAGRSDAPVFSGGQ
jgi:putative heme-binding domain-containing protein